MLFHSNNLVTTNECAKVLLNAGANKINSGSIALAD